MSHAKANKLNVLTPTQVELLSTVDFTVFPIDFSRLIDSVTEAQVLEWEEDDPRGTRLNVEKSKYSKHGRKTTYDMGYGNNRGVSWDNLPEIVEEQTGLVHGEDFLVYTYAVNTLRENSRTRLIIREQPE